MCHHHHNTHLRSRHCRHRYGRHHYRYSNQSDWNTHYDGLVYSLETLPFGLGSIFGKFLRKYSPTIIRNPNRDPDRAYPQQQLPQQPLPQQQPWKQQSWKQKPWKQQKQQDPISLTPQHKEDLVSTLRQVFPDCDIDYIRYCIDQETHNHLENISNWLMETNYPKVSAPPAEEVLPLDHQMLNSNQSSLFDVPPPTYQEAITSSSSSPKIQRTRFP